MSLGAIWPGIREHPQEGRGFPQILDRTQALSTSECPHITAYNNSTIRQVSGALKQSGSPNVQKRLLQVGYCQLTPTVSDKLRDGMKA